MIVALVLVVLWYSASSGRGYLLRVDFSFTPEAIGAEVVVDGEVIDTLEVLRRQLINGVRVPRGEHVVVIRSERCVGTPLTVAPASGERNISIFVHLFESTVENRFVCTFGLRR